MLVRDAGFEVVLAGLVVVVVAAAVLGVGVHVVVIVAAVVVAVLAGLRSCYQAYSCHAT